MKEVKDCEELTKIGIESEIVDLNAQIFDIEQRMSEDGLGQDEMAFLGQELSGMYDSLDRYNDMLSQFEGKSKVDEFKEYIEEKQQSQEEQSEYVEQNKKSPTNYDYMGR